MAKFNRYGTTPALEELEIEKLIAKDEQNQDGLAFDGILSDVKDKVEQQNEPSPEEKPEPASDAAQASSDGSDEPGERVSGDTDVTDSPEPDSDDDEHRPEADESTPAEPDELPEEDEGPVLATEASELVKYTGGEWNEEEDVISTNICAESLRTLMSKRIADTVGFEAYEVGITEMQHDEKDLNHYDNRDWREWGRKVTSEGGSVAGRSVRWLANLGINLAKDTIPKIAKQTYKGLLYAFDHLAFGFMVGLTALDQYITRRIKSFSNLNENIHKAKEAIETLKRGTASSIDNEAFTNEMGIRQLSIQDSVDLIEHLGILIQFVRSTITELGVSIKEDIGSIEQLIAESHLSGSNDVYKLLQVDLRMTNLQQGDVAGFEKTNPHLFTSYHVATVLPGNTVLIAHMPSPEPKQREEWIEAYRDSDMFLGVDRSKFKLVEKIPYYEPDDLIKMCDLLSQLCKVCIDHQAFYEGLKKMKLSQRMVYKNYFDGIVRGHEKTSIKDSLIDLVTMKNNFIDKVYLPAAIDTHDYVVRVITDYLKFIAKNINVLKG